MKNTNVLFATLFFFFFSLTSVFSQENMKIIEINGGFVCGYGTMPNDSNLIAPEGMATYLWSTGSTGQTTRFWSNIPGSYQVWCVIEGHDTLHKTVWVIPSFTGPHYLKKVEDKIFIDIQDTFVLSGKLKCFWYLDGIEIQSENSYFITPKKSGRYTAKIEQLCYGGVYIIQKYVDVIITSSEDNLKEEALKVYPNPATDHLNISRPSENVSIMNLTGQIVATFNGMSQKIDISNLSPGFYFIKIGNKVKKFQKNIVL